MKRFLALMMALLLLVSAATAETAAVAEGSAYGMRIWRNHQETDSDGQQIVLDYPTFECDDKNFEQFLTENITDPILQMGTVGEGSVRGGYYASLDFDGLLSVEASIHKQPSGAQHTEVELFYAIVDLSGKRLLTIEELFQEPDAVVDEAICNAVYQVAAEYDLLLESISDSGLVPLPDSYYLTAEALRVLYDTQTLSAQAMALDLYWDELPLTWSPVLTGEKQIAEPEADASIGIIGGADGPTAIFVAAGTDVPEDILEQWPDAVVVTSEPESIPAVTQVPPAAPEETAELHQDAVNATPEPGIQPEMAENIATAEPIAFATLEPTVTPVSTVTPFPAETLNPNFELAPVVTPTPMPVAGNDAMMVDVLTHGLWKPLGTDGDTYYQFTADGKLLTVTVTDYRVKDGVLTSEILNGELDIGSDSAFVLRDGSQMSGYVLNRQGERVAPEEFVTPSPTPVPTPTPTPTPTPSPTPEPTPTPTPAPTPTPTPTPEPTPSPTPTLSPWENALMTAPKMGSVEAAFEKARTLKVYSAPDENAWAAERAQVTTDETVAVYGVEDQWVLVSYAIGDGSRGRTGYIDNMTLADPESVPELRFCSIPLTLMRNAKATDDPLRSRTTITTLEKGEQVTLLAFFGHEWAYVETTYEQKPCRLFIPVSALEEN